MKTEILLNKDGGTLKELDADKIATELRDAFAAHGHDSSATVVESKQLEAALDQAASRSDLECLVIGGGDGTVSAAAGRLAGTDIALGTMPFGTLNLFARMLQVPIDYHQAIDGLATASVRQVDLGEVNGRRFVHHVSLGLHPSLIRRRDLQGYGSRLGKLWNSMRAWARLVRRPPRLEVSAISKEAVLSRTTPFLIVTNNPLGQGIGRLPHAEDPSRGQLALYLSGPLSSSELLRLSATAALGQWQDNDLLDTVITDQLDIESRRRKVLASVDGEILRIETPLRCRSLPAALRVLVPEPQ